MARRAFEGPRAHRTASARCRPLAQLRRRPSGPRGTDNEFLSGPAPPHPLTKKILTQIIGTQISKTFIGSSKNLRAPWTVGQSPKQRSHVKNSHRLLISLFCINMIVLNRCQRAIRVVVVNPSTNFLQTTSIRPSATFAARRTFCRGVDNEGKDAEEDFYGGGRRKMLKIAVIGMPNSGKSTLINQVIERRVCATSLKVHTTVRKARAIDNSGNTQLIFLDTPGLVTKAEMKKHALDTTFTTAPMESIQEADLIAVVHDVSNKWTRDYLDRKILFLLQQVPEKESILVLNKVDLLSKQKRFLLPLTEKLTEGSLKSLQHYDFSHLDHNSTVINESGPAVENRIEDNELPGERVGWNKFSDIFMVSALTGEGVGDIKEFMLMRAKSATWQFDADTYSDQDCRQLVEEAVREKLLDHLPQEIPYKISSEMEFFAPAQTGILCISVLVHCQLPRHQKILLGGGGNKIRVIAKEAEQTLANCFRTPVKLKIVVDVVSKKPSIDDGFKKRSLLEA